ncbi:hypothetical protein BDQ12DRAFT_769093 [Crucibulum laeve]|uniref:Fungal-type protein kinase domain-containing protein n=1 Tax=Crucibulum laeve TaxID=68775 RepID=A0A5C3LKA2_9AGAR|nr:hypothetical protein BDQ12DRAFT_769093 [Crucibulum laeve]
MATLDAPLQFPPALIRTVIPSVAQQIAGIPLWVIYHFKQTFTCNVHYENQLYGCINNYLQSIFPLSRRFMIIPQALVRRPLIDDEVPDDLRRVSFGSTGALHESRILSGTEAGKLIPDFLVVKVTPRPGTERAHRVLDVVEIKRDDETAEKADTQMKTYMEGLLAHTRDPNLRGFLVMGNSVRVYRIEVDKKEGPLIVGYPVSDMFNSPNGDIFTDQLFRSARDNWN